MHSRIPLRALLAAAVSSLGCGGEDSNGDAVVACEYMIGGTHTCNEFRGQAPTETGCSEGGGTPVDACPPGAAAECSFSASWGEYVSFGYGDGIDQSALDAQCNALEATLGAASPEEESTGDITCPAGDGPADVPVDPELPAPLHDLRVCMASALPDFEETEFTGEELLSDVPNTLSLEAQWSSPEHNGRVRARLFLQVAPGLTICAVNRSPEPGHMDEERVAAAEHAAEILQGCVECTVPACR